MLAVVFLIVLGVVAFLLILASLRPNEGGIRTTGDARLDKYVLTDGARQRLRERLDAAVKGNGRDFGNGRFVRNMFERAIGRQATRLAGCADLSPEVLEQLTTADIP